MPESQKPQETPWLQLEGEADAAYAGFCVYRDLPGKRSIARAALKLALNHRTLELYSSQTGWPERAKAYDEHLRRIKLTAVEDEVREQAKAFVAELKIINERFLERAHSMLDSPLYRETRDDQNENLIILEPANWRQRDAALFVREAMKVQERIKELESEETKAGGLLGDLMKAVREAYGTLPPESDSD